MSKPINHNYPTKIKKLLDKIEVDYADKKVKHVNIKSNKKSPKLMGLK